MNEPSTLEGSLPTCCTHHGITACEPPGSQTVYDFLRTKPGLSLPSTNDAGSGRTESIESTPASYTGVGFTRYLSDTAGLQPNTETAFQEWYWA